MNFQVKIKCISCTILKESEQKTSGCEVLRNLAMCCAFGGFNLSKTSVNLRVWTSSLLILTFLNDLHSKREFIQRARTLFPILFSLANYPPGGKSAEKLCSQALGKETIAVV